MLKFIKTQADKDAKKIVQDAEEDFQREKKAYIEFEKERVV